MNLHSALDAVNQKLVLDLLQKLHKEQPFGYVFVSHDIGLLQAVTDRIIVMKDGQIVETIESKRLKRSGTPIYKITCGSKFIKKCPCLDMLFLLENQ